MRCFAAFAAFVLFVTGAAAQLSSAGRHPSAPILNPSAPLLLPQARPIVVSPAPFPDRIWGAPEREAVSWRLTNALK